MKKLTLFALAGAALLASACSKQAEPQTLTAYCENRLAGATSLQDSIIAIDGSYVGAYFNIQSSRLPVKNLNKSEMLRGMRDVLGVDTANVSYLYGLQMGMAVMNTYKELAEGADISKEAFIASVSGAFRLDSISVEEVNELQPQFEQMFARVQELAKQKRESGVFNSEPARQNRMLGEAVAEKLQSEPGYKPVGSQGLLIKRLSESSGEVINPNSVVMVEYTISRIDSGSEIRHSGPARMFAGRPNNEVVASVLPFMSVGDTAEFFVPYELAYGVSGNGRLGVGPCESVMIKLSVTPVEED